MGAGMWAEVVADEVPLVPGRRAPPALRATWFEAP
jgi:hypothetical protein